MRIDTDILTHAPYRAVCEQPGCSWVSDSMERLSAIVAAMNDHKATAHKPVFPGYPAPGKPSLIVSGH